MPTLVTLTVKPSGGDYTLLNSALGAIPADIVATDETYVIECDTFSGGLNEEVIVPAITTDITRRVKIKAATGHEYVYETGAGFWIWAARNFSGAVTNQNSDYVDMEGFGVKNTGSNAARGIRSSNGRINATYKNLVILDAPSSACLEINGIKDGVIDNVLTTNGNIGINYNNFSDSVSTNCTVINAAQQAYRRVSGGSNGNLLTNCLEIGSGSFNDAGGDFHADSDYNASSEVTAPIGANSLANRTTADLADYAGGDYRTKSTSALANSGSGGTFIGYALEAGGIPTASFSSANTSSSSMQGYELYLAQISSSNTSSSSMQGYELYLAQISSSNTSSSALTGYERYQGSFSSSSPSSSILTGYERYSAQFASSVSATSQLVAKVRYNGTFNSTNTSASSISSLVRYLASIASSNNSTSAFAGYVKLNALFSSNNTSSSSFSFGDSFTSFTSITSSSSSFSATIRLTGEFESLNNSASSMKVRAAGLGESKSTFKIFVKSKKLKLYSDITKVSVLANVKSKLRVETINLTGEAWK